MRTILIFFFLVSGNFSLQAQKSSCIYGNCKNGFGIKKNSGAAGAQAFPDKGWTSAGGWENDFYEIGEFSKGSLNGKGYRLSTFDVKNLETRVKSGQPLQPDLVTQAWFESGTYKDGYLHGKGILLEIDYRNKRPYRVSEGNYEKGYFTGEGIKFIPTTEGLIYTKQDPGTGKFSLETGRQLHGRFVSDICYDCTVTEIRGGQVAGTSVGGIFQNGFLSGWVLKDYETDPGSNAIKKVKPFKALYGAGTEVKRWPDTEELTRKDTIRLQEGYIYTGETDDTGKPFGFGTIEWPGSVADTYTGYVDNGKPNGWGITYNKQYASRTMAGLFRNHEFMHGVIYLPVMGVVLSCGDGGTSSPNFSQQLGDIIDGPYRKRYYVYDYATRTYKLAREESGTKVRGYEKNVWVSMGLTAAEKKKQRVVSNGYIQRNDLAEGDVIVVGGMAQLVIAGYRNELQLKSGKPIPLSTTFQLSKHPSSAFETLCPACKGAMTETYTYQRPPELVYSPRTVTETVVYDITIWKTVRIVHDSYTKTFPPEKRTRPCPACNGKGKTKDLAEFAE